MARGTSLLAGLALAFSLGCAPPEPLNVDMKLKATNTADKILIVEGQTSLPGGAPLVATVKDGDGKVQLTDRGVVRQGRFYFDFDLTSLNGLNLYQVWVVFDPHDAPLGVRTLTGFWGEAMEGVGVVADGDTRIVRRQMDVLLTSSGNWNTRDFHDMSERERDRVIRELEKLVDGKPDDRALKVSLAKGYIAADKRELSIGSRAHQLLKDAALSPEPDKISKEADTLLAGLEKEDAAKKTVQKKRRAAARGSKYYDKKEVKPGRALGGFILGTPFDAIRRHFTITKSSSFANAKKDVLVTMKELPGVELTFGRRSKRLIRARTTSKEYMLPEGFRVGSLLQELQEAYGTDAVPKPKFRNKEKGPDGTLYYRGKVLTNGLEFEIVKTVDPVFGLPVDKVEAMSVFRR